MSTLTIELPQGLATKLESSRVPTSTLNEFLVGALEAWLRRRPSPAVEVDRTSWNAAFQGSGESGDHTPRRAKPARLPVYA